MMRLTRTAPPSAFPVELDEVKRHCRVFHDDDDPVLTGLIAAATDYLDGPSGILGRAIVTQEWLLELPSLRGDITLPLEPVQSVSVSYIDADGTEQAVSGADYELDQYPSQRTVLRWRKGFVWPALDVSSRYPVRLVVMVGFGGGADVPEALKVAMKMMIAHWFLHPEAVSSGSSMSEVPLGVSALLTRWRVLL